MTTTLFSVMVLLFVCTSSTKVHLVEESFHEREFPDFEIIQLEIPEILVSRYVNLKKEERLQITLNGNDFQLVLQRNEEVISTNLKTNNSELKSLANCFYQGYIDGEAGSMAALNLCNGCRWHAVSRLDKLIPPLLMCNGAIKTSTPFEKPKGKRFRRSLLTDTKYIELLLVADTSEFLQHGSTTAVNNRLASFVNIADSLFQPLNVRVVLSHLESWNTTNMINIGSDIHTNLDAFTAYRRSQLAMGVATNSWQLTDHAMLVQHSRGEKTIGLAYLHGMCSNSISSSITHDFSDSVAAVGVVMAHELGHSLGISHDVDYCVCNHSQPTQCIMHPNTNPSTMWSNCSVAHLETFLRDYDPGCLLNVPHPDNIFTTSICGNGITERGEECDCGYPGSCNLRCCNSTSCMLLPTAQCTTGVCCASNCSFEPAGTVCRNQSHADCDLPEFCSGTSGECSEDFFRKDSVPCQNGSGVCLSGVCWNRDRQCKESWGSNAWAANDICYISNGLGRAYGNCGFMNSQYIACNRTDLMCGSLFCDYTTSSSSMSVIIYTLITGGSRCISFTSPASDMVGVGQVRNGLACGTNKICMGSKCRDIPQNSLECDAMCSTNGVCNNKCHCHCNIGWAPPFCNVTGLGGSIDSGSASVQEPIVFEIVIDPVVTTVDVDMSLELHGFMGNLEPGPIFVEKDETFNIKLKASEAWSKTSHIIMVDKCWAADKHGQSSQPFFDIVNDGSLVGDGSLVSNSSDVRITSKASADPSGRFPPLNVYCQCVICIDDVGNC